MFTRYSTRILLLILSIAAFNAAARPSKAIVVSQTFDLPIPSLDDPEAEFGRGRMDDAIIIVDEHFLIEDLDVAVLLTHEAFYDIEIVLKSPAGTTITLNPAANSAFLLPGPGGMTSAGGQNRFLFDDEAAINIENAVQPFDQPFRPATGWELSAFDGQDAYGAWRLQITDVWFYYTGRLEEVELTFSTPEPTSALLLTIGALAARFIRGPATHGQFYRSRNHQNAKAK
jgi:subtilisin-like proprotein convertase family protein